MNAEQLQAIMKIDQERLQEAQADLELLKQLERSTSPCGHLARYAYTENGGKNIVCLLCELRQREAELEQLRKGRQAAWDSEFELRRQVADLTALPSPPKEGNDE